MINPIWTEKAVQKYKTVTIYRQINEFVLVLLSKPLCILRSNRSGSNGSFVGAAGLSQGPVVRHGGEERVPQLTVDEEHDEEDEEEQHQTHHHIRGQVGFVGLSLSQRAPAARGLQEGRHTHGPVGHVQRRLRVCVAHQVEVSRRCRGVQQHLPQHDQSRLQQTNILHMYDYTRKQSHAV